MKSADEGTIRDWRQTMLIALDAMKERRSDISEPLFDELDGLHPGWQFEVPMRGRVNSRKSIDKAARCLIVTMLRWATMNGYYDGPRSISKSDIARLFGFSKATIDTDVSRGERQLLNAGKDWPNGTEYEKKYPASGFGGRAPVYWWPTGLIYNIHAVGVGFLEEDYDSEDERREKRRQAVLYGERTVIRRPGAIQTLEPI